MANKRNRKMKVATPYGEGTIFFSNSTGRWMGQVIIGRDANGKIKRKSVYGKDAAEVKQKLQQIKYDIYTGDFVDISNVSFAQLEKQILDEKLNMNEIKEQTHFRHLETLKMIGEIADYPLQKITESTIRKRMIEIVDHYSQSSINKIFMMLNQCFREAVKRKIIASNPMEDIKKPKSKQIKVKVRGLTLQEQKLFLEALEQEHSKYEDQMLISLWTGMRMGEINALRRTDINQLFKCINVDKTISKGKTGDAFINPIPKTEAGIRTVPITEQIAPVINKLLSQKRIYRDGQLFHTTIGTLVSTSVVNDEFKRILKKYNIIDPTVKGKVTLHSLRHTFATRCIEGGMKPTVLQKIMGHTDIHITLDTYSDVFDQYTDENLEKVNEYLNKVGLAV